MSSSLSLFLLLTQADAMTWRERSRIQTLLAVVPEAAGTGPRVARGQDKWPLREVSCTASGTARGAWWFSPCFPSAHT
jgi:hypothetical protein